MNGTAEHNDVHALTDAELAELKAQLRERFGNGECD